MTFKGFVAVAASCEGLSFVRETAAGRAGLRREDSAGVVRDD
jgi:hypothetical protein